MSKPELKPCPFCGCKEVSVGGKTGWLNEDIWYVGCPECGAQGPELLTNEEDAIKEWNERAE